MLGPQQENDLNSFEMTFTLKSKPLPLGYLERLGVPFSFYYYEAYIY